MKVTKFEDRDEWMVARNGKITGTRLKEVYSEREGSKKIGFYELIAERLAIEPDGENPMDRGVRLEPEAIARFEKETKKKVKTGLVIWSREDNPDIAISPDGSISKTAALEIKCLGSARHIEAYLTQQVPKEYEHQVLQYFIVNDNLKTLYFAFYDPRIPAKDFFFLKIERKDIEEKIEKCLEFERQTLKEVEEIVNKLSF